MSNMGVPYCLLRQTSTGGGCSWKPALAYVRAMADRLSTYRAKRDFTQDGGAVRQAAKPSRGGNRYLIQKHDATRLHFDFRLELDGVLLSWAVTRGPSLDPQRSGWPSMSRTIRSTTATSRGRSPRASTAAAR